MKKKVFLDLGKKKLDSKCLGYGKAYTAHPVAPAMVRSAITISNLFRYSSDPKIVLYLKNKKPNNMLFAIEYSFYTYQC